MVWTAMQDACVEMLHLTDTLAHADFILLAQSRTLRIL